MFSSPERTENEINMNFQKEYKHQAEEQKRKEFYTVDNYKEQKRILNYRENLQSNQMKSIIEDEKKGKRIHFGPMA